MEDNWMIINGEKDMPPENIEVLVSISEETEGNGNIEYTSVGWRIGPYWIVDNEVNYDVVAWQCMPAPVMMRKRYEY